MKDFWICVISLKRKKHQWLSPFAFWISQSYLMNFCMSSIAVFDRASRCLRCERGDFKRGKTGREYENISGMFIFLGVQKHLLSILPAVHVHSQVHVKSLKKSLAIAWLRHSLNVLQTVRQSEKRTNLLALGVDFSFGHPTVELWVRSMLSNSSSDRTVRANIQASEREQMTPLLYT